MAAQSWIDVYFTLGFSYTEIQALLSQRHNIVISFRHLKRLINGMSLYRRKYYTDLVEVVDFLHMQLQTSGKLHGYRWMHQKCLQNGLVVQKEKIRELLKILDPDGVAIRSRRRLKRRPYRNKGPNYLWHIDSYDKLAPYGIYINGCIDGFSRNIIWVEAGKTNSDPRVIAGYFIRAILSKKGMPLRIRGDMGTENTIVARMQEFLHEENNTESRGRFIYGTSQHNQRIESWWGILRREHAQF